MDLNENGMLFCDGELTKNNYGDTTLRLECFGYGGSISAGFGSARTEPGDCVVRSKAPDDGCRLVLGLGPTPSAYSDSYHTGWANKIKGLAPLVDRGLSSDGDSVLKLGLSGGNAEVPSIFDFPVSAQSYWKQSHHLHKLSVDVNGLGIPILDEGSTSAKRSGGYMPSLVLAPQTQELLEPGTKSRFSTSNQLSSEPSSAVTDYSISFVSQAVLDHRTGIPKKCKFEGCSKVARGGPGLCIGHGGGQRCQKTGCNKGAEGRAAYCKAHGGGKRCQHLGCTKSAEGRTDYCIAHGGGRRCVHPGGCSKAARGKSGLCIRHGGGKRCKVGGCSRSAEGQIGLCISHGGGRRCQSQGCTNGAQGSTVYCKAHGGGKRCIFTGCTKGAEGSTPLCKGHGGGKRCLFDGGGICPKSVHGGTDFCVTHGGGKRCVVPGCTKSARGRTDCCVRHGGGKRCKFENCRKSAQGSTDFCKAHGGGKRCSWGERKCEKFARGKSGLCAAHSSMVQEQEKNKGGMIESGLFHGLVSASSTITSGFVHNCSSSGVSTDWDSMKCSSSYSRPLSSEKRGEVCKGGGAVGCGGSAATADVGMRKSSGFVVTEGRVHDGGLLSLLGGSLKNAIDGI
ncbi:hypothetical protein U1Q18_035372 [Sarracenia purpurea var. burkii]